MKNIFTPECEGEKIVQETQAQAHSFIHLQEVEQENYFQSAFRQEGKYFIWRFIIFGFFLGEIQKITNKHDQKNQMKPVPVHVVFAIYSFWTVIF